MEQVEIIAIEGRNEYTTSGIHTFEDAKKSPAGKSENWEKMRWNNGEKFVEVSFQKGTLQNAILDQNYCKILAVYIRNTTYALPANAVIYNLDGSVYKILAPPVLQGKSAAYFGTANLKGDHFGGLVPNWYINSKGQKVVGVAVKYPSIPTNKRFEEFFEVREINLETGEFGEVLDEGTA